MAKHGLHTRGKGFSLVELMVALVFTLVLMAGLASVFKASLSSFYTSGEALSSVRRNRMAVDLLGDDLNSAGMYLLDLSTPPREIVATQPPFFILPNMPIVGAGPADPATADQLFFYMDQPLPFEGRLRAVGASQTHAELVMGGAPAGVADQRCTIECTNDYAKMVKKGQRIILKDVWEPGYIAEDPDPPVGNLLTVVLGKAPNADVTGAGPGAGLFRDRHLDGSGVVIVQPGQMVRYSIQMLQLDPTNPNGIPCLVRDQGAYNQAGFVADQPQQIITENVSGFKVYLSGNSGQAWAGLGLAAAGFVGGWDQGIRTELDTQLAASGRPGFTSTRGSEHWFRSIPVLVRVDVSTRTATQREEYATAPNTVAHRDFTQSLVFVPKHTGLAMEPLAPN